MPLSSDVILSVIGLPLESRSADLEFSNGFDFFIMDDWILDIVSCIGATSFKITLRKNFVWSILYFFISGNILSSLILQQIAGLPLKRVSPDFQFSLRFDLFQMLDRIVDIVASVGAPFLKFALWHNFILWKCGLLGFFSHFSWIVNCVERVALKFVAAYPKLSFSLHQFSSNALCLDKILEVRRVSFKLSFGQDFVLGVEGLFGSDSAAGVVFVITCITALDGIVFLRENIVFVDEVVSGHFGRTFWFGVSVAWLQLLVTLHFRNEK